MVKISKFDSNLSDTFNCNALSIKNNGQSEAEITFNSSGDTLSIQRGTIVYVFNSNQLVSDTYNVVFTSQSTANELEVIQTTYSASSTTDNLTRIAERNVYVNIVPDVGLNKYDISRFQTGTVTFSYNSGIVINGVYDPLNTVAAIQTKNCAPNIEGSVYGAWVDLNNIKGKNAITTFGLGTLSSSSPHIIKEGVYFDLSDSNEFIVVKNASLGIIYSQVRKDWYDPLDGAGPSGVVFDFALNRGIFYFEYIYSGNKVNVYLSYAGQEILVNSFINTSYPAIFDNPRQQVFVRAEAIEIGSSFLITFRGCSIYNCSNSQVPRNLGCASKTFNAANQKYTTGFLSGYLGMAFKRLQTGTGYRFLRLKDFQVQSSENQPFSVLLVLNPTITNTNTPPSLLSYTFPFGAFGTQEPLAFANNTDGFFEITNYDLCVNVSQHVHHSELVEVVNQFLGNEINGDAQVIALMILPSVNNQQFRVSATVEEI
jgi:hypothetical protein